MGWASSEDCQFRSGDGSVRARLGRPARPGRCPAMIVFHGARGPGLYTTRVVERLGEDGYVALAPYWQAQDQDPPDMLLMQWVKDAGAYLQGLEYVDGERIGMAGYCRGGGLTILALGQNPFLRVGISFHGFAFYNHLTPDKPTHPFDLAERITAPLLILHGMSDPTFAVQDMFRLAERLNTLGKSFQFTAYNGLGHAFTLPDGGAYSPEAAEDAWEATIRFLKRSL